MGNAACGVTLQHFIGELDVGLQLGALPVLLDGFMPLLDREWRVAVVAIRREEGRQQVFVAGFPGALVVLHEFVDIHSLPP